MFGLPRNESYQLYAAYAALVFLTPILGGIVADRWIGSNRAVIIGCVLGILGNVILVSLHRYWFGLGLATALVGSGFYKSSASKLIGEFYQKGDYQKNAGYTWFYLATNLGGTLSPLLYGIVAYTLGWNYSFLCGALGLTISLVWLTHHWYDLPNTKLINARILTMVLIGTVILIFAVSLLFFDVDIINIILALLFTVSIIYLLTIIRQHHNNERKHLYAILCLSFFGAFYFAIGLQVGITITLFIQNRIHSGLINFNLPASAFSMLYSLFVIILAPFITLLWSTLKQKNCMLTATNKLLLGIILAGVAMLVFAYAATSHVILPFIVFGFAVLSAGELILSPAIYTTISDLSPTDMKSTMMGCWLLFIALGGFLSSFIANTAHRLQEHYHISIHPYAGEFILIASFTFVVSIILLIMSRKIAQLMG